jgi:hypothetical protein
MSSNRFESIWQAWHFSDNSQQTGIRAAIQNLTRVRIFCIEI